LHPSRARAASNTRDARHRTRGIAPSGATLRARSSRPHARGPSRVAVARLLARARGTKTARARRRVEVEVEDAPIACSRAS
jgi:hypothetical protein